MGNQYEKPKAKNTNLYERKKTINGKEVEYEEYIQYEKMKMIEELSEGYGAERIFKRTSTYFKIIKYKNEEKLPEEEITYREFANFMDYIYRKAPNEKRKSDIKLKWNKYYVYYD